MFSDHLGIQPEVLYSAQGAKSGDQKYKVNYVTVPVLVRYNINEMWSLHAGPQFGVLTSAKYSTGSNEQDVKDQLKGTDIAIAAWCRCRSSYELNFAFRFVSRSV
jgi:hypothetical protein